MSKANDASGWTVETVSHHPDDRYVQLVKNLQLELVNVRAELEVTKAVLHDYVEDKGLDKHLHMLRVAVDASRPLAKHGSGGAQGYQRLDTLRKALSTLDAYAKPQKRKRK